MDLSLQTLFIAVVAGMVITRRIGSAAMLWRRIARVYAARRPSMGRIVHGTSMYVGDTNFGPLVSYRISPRGLYMELPALINLILPPVIVPWTDLVVRKYVRAPLFRGYDVALAGVTIGDDILMLRLPDNVVRHARMFLVIPELERAD